MKIQVEDHRVCSRRIEANTVDLVKAYCALVDVGESESADRILPTMTKKRITEILALSVVNTTTMLKAFREILEREEQNENNNKK